MNSPAMSRNFLALAFALGLIAVVWVGVGFVGTSWFALAMTVVIGGVYLVGAQEIRRFRTLTAGLAAALADVPQPLHSLSDWIGRVPSSLQNAVRARVEGERGALPGLALTPYLIGLLVMLGMLGTFLGMVVTFKGAVFTLEGSSDLQAIRSALAAPIKGLGLAFGTSVVGVATSAMLGLMSTICRRERMEVARLLDARISTEFRPFTLAHQQRASYQAMQQQADALPAVVSQLNAFMAQIERRHQQLDAQLLERQAQFQHETTTAYTGLASSVAQSLQDSLTASARVAGESIKPVVENAMAAIAQESTRLHERVSDAVHTQMSGLSAQFGATAGTVAAGWASALQQHAHTSEQQVSGLGQALAAFTRTFEERSAALLASVQHTVSQSQAEQTVADQHKQATWAQALQGMATTLQSEWQQVGAQTLAQQQAVCQTLEHTASAITERASQQASRSLEDMARLLAQSEELVRARAASEAAWAQQHGERMDQLAVLWRTELTALRTEESTHLQTLRAEEAARGQAAVDRLAALQTELATHLQALRSEEATRGDAAVQRLTSLQTELATQLQTLRGDEAARGDAAVARLGELQTGLASHLATLGTALEAPMTRLLATASEAPKAAAEVIAQLRQEMSQLAERDNHTLAERATLVEHISNLLQTVQQATGEQRAAIESLVTSASAVLDQVGHQFADTVGAQAGRAEHVAAQVAGSAVELASLGEAFGQGVQLFSATNQQLIESLQRVEGAVSQSMVRSDEQLAYYVAQAREVIDLSISSQQGIVEDLRLLRDARGKPAAAKPAPIAEGTA